MNYKDYADYAKRNGTYLESFLRLVRENTDWVIAATENFEPSLDDVDWALNYWQGDAKPEGV